MVGIKLRKDDRSAFPAIYFNSPSMGQGRSGPATTEDLTNAVSTFSGQLPHAPKLFCLPLTQQKLWPAMSFWPQTAGPVLPTEVLRIWNLSRSWYSATDLVRAGLLGPWADLKGAKCPHREIPGTFLTAPSRCCWQWLETDIGVGDGGTS